MSETFQPASIEIWEKKYQLKDKNGIPVDQSIEGDNSTFRRVAKALASVEPKDQDHWEEQFYWALCNGAIPAGRITSNAGAEEYKPGVSLINCTVHSTVHDSIEGIFGKGGVAGAADTLSAGCGTGYEFSTLRPKNSYVSGVGATTSGSLSFMDVFDKMCFTISSAGGRRGAQMATFDISHPDVLDFIKAKREDGRFRQFNLSVLITDEFVEAVKNGGNWEFIFPVHQKKYSGNCNDYVWKKIHWNEDYFVHDGDLVAHEIYYEMPAKEVWDIIMQSTYDYAEPGFLLIDKINEMNTLHFMENIRATNPCGRH